MLLPCASKNHPVVVDHFQDFPTEAGLFASGTAKIYVALAPQRDVFVAWSDQMRKKSGHFAKTTWTPFFI